MDVTQNEDPKGIEFRPFDANTVLGLFGAGCSTDYLNIYLGDLKTASVLYEPHYVDRHYLDEFAHYYSKSFNVPPPHCNRLHFFSCSRDDLEKSFHAATGFPQDSPSLERLRSSYLGFIVRRPLASARIGRTVLRTYSPEGHRRYEATRAYRVHLAGLVLPLEGLAFQHQDRGAAVCASTSLWSALQRVAPMSGNRTPTPHAITEAAGSPYPASVGLTDAGMATALRRLGYIADYFTPSENRSWFRALVVASLESHLAVVLLLSKKVRTGAGEVEVGHAISVTGFGEPIAVGDVPCSLDNVDPIRMKADGLKVIYAHDDNLGPHAHYELVDSDERDKDGNPKLMIMRGDSRGARPPSWPIDYWRVEAALVPKPEKLRLSLSSLLENIVYVRPLMDLVFGNMPIHWKSRFTTGVEIKESLINRDVDDSQRRSVLFGRSLPRHVGVLSALHGTSTLCEIVIDVTEVDRTPGEPRPLAVIAGGVPAQSTAGARLRNIAEHFRVPVVLGK